MAHHVRDVRVEGAFVTEVDPLEVDDNSAALSIAQPNPRRREGDALTIAERPAMSQLGRNINTISRDGEQELGDDALLNIGKACSR